MSAWDQLAAAVLALAPSGTVLGEVDAASPLPWRSLRVSVPGVSSRSEATPAHGYTVRVSGVVSAATDTGALRIAQGVSDSLEGSRPVADGWLCGPILSRGSSKPYTTDVVLQEPNRRLVSVPLAFEFTATKMPEEAP